MRVLNPRQLQHLHSYGRKVTKCLVYTVAIYAIKNVENAVWLLFLKMVKSGYQITDPAADSDYTYWRRGIGNVTLKHFPVLHYKTTHILTPLESQVPLLDMLLLLCP